MFGNFVSLLTVLGCSAWLMNSEAVCAVDATKKPLVFCTVEWPPYTIVDKDTKMVKGLHTDLIREVFARVGRTVEIHEMPWKRCFKMAEMGKIDGIYSASYKEERAEVVNYPEEPLEEIGYVFATLEDPSKIKWDNKKDLKNMPQPIGSPLGFSVTGDLKAAGVEVDDSAVNDQVNFEKLVKGRVKSIVIVKSALEAFQKAFVLNGEKVKVHILEPAYIEGKKYFVTISKKVDGSMELVKKIDEALRSMRQDGFMTALHETYFSTSS